ncbi:MAG: hypothetical protein ACOCU0_03715, partial [Bacillota bacterium]
GRELPWESERECSLIWKNILSVSLNFLEVSDVVVDYVAFMSDARYLKKHLPNEVTMKYIVLDASLETLKQRDRMRPPNHQMKERAPILKREFDEDRVTHRSSFIPGILPAWTSMPSLEPSKVKTDTYSRRRYNLLK